MTSMHYKSYNPGQLVYFKSTTSIVHTRPFLQTMQSMQAAHWRDFHPWSQASCNLEVKTPSQTIRKMEDEMDPPRILEDILPQAASLCAQAKTVGPA